MGVRGEMVSPCFGGGDLLIQNYFVEKCFKKIIFPIWKEKECEKRI